MYAHTDEAFSPSVLAPWCDPANRRDAFIDPSMPTDHQCARYAAVFLQRPHLCDIKEGINKFTRPPLLLRPLNLDFSASPG